MFGLRFVASRGFVGTVETRLLSVKRDGTGLISLVRSSPFSEYYLGNRKTGDLVLVAETQPELPEARLVGKQPAHITTRDGLVLRACLTRPAKASGALPLVLLPHGGPHSRDDTQFDVWTEFLASRGYAVHGTDDRTVPFEQGEAMDKALRRAKVAHRFVELEGGDHQLGRNSHRLTVWPA